MPFLDNHIFIQAATVDAGAAATTDVESAAVDAANCDSVVFIVSFGTIVTDAVTSIKVQQCDTSGGSYTDLEGTAITVADSHDNKTFLIEVARPREQFLKCIVDRGTENATVGAIVAIKTNVAQRPVTQGTNIQSYETHMAPAEGTA